MKNSSTWLRKSYDIPRSQTLFHSGNFFLEIEEYDQALASLLDAEKYLNELTTHKNITVIILNAIQSIYQRRNENDKGLIYAQKILNHIDKVGHTDEKYYNLCKGLVRIDMSEMKLKLNQIRESEVLATEGHQIIGGQPSEYILGSEAEFDALIVLIDIKIKLNKYEEAVKLIQRAQQLYQIYGDREGAYFKRIALYEHQIAVAKYEHDWKEVVELQNLLTPVQDSFERKNDIRKQESLKQQNKIEYRVNMSSSNRITVDILPRKIKQKTKNQVSMEIEDIETLDELERREIIKALNKYKDYKKDKDLVAKALGISRATLYLKLDKYNIISK